MAAASDRAPRGLQRETRESCFLKPLPGSGTTCSPFEGREDEERDQGASRGSWTQCSVLTGRVLSDLHLLEEEVGFAFVPPWPTVIS